VGLLLRVFKRHYCFVQFCFGNASVCLVISASADASTRSQFWYKINAIFSAIQFRFQFPFESWHRRWVGNSRRLTVPRACGRNKKNTVADRSASWIEFRWQVQSMLTTESQHRQMVFNSLRCTQPVKNAQKRSDMVVLPDSETQSSRCVHGRLKSVGQLTRQTGKSCSAV